MNQEEKFKNTTYLKALETLKKNENFKIFVEIINEEFSSEISLAKSESIEEHGLDLTKPIYGFQQVHRMIGDLLLRVTMQKDGVLDEIREESRKEKEQS